MYSGPLEYGCPFDAMLRKTRCIGDGADREHRLLVEHFKGTFVTGRHGGKNDASLALEACGFKFKIYNLTRSSSLTFCAAVNERFQTLWVLRINQVYERRVDPPTRLHRVEATNHEIELHVIVVVFVLNLSKVAASYMQRESSSQEARTYGVTFTPDTRFITYSAATIAFGLPMSACLLIVLSTWASL